MCNCATVVTFIFLVNILFLFILTHLFTVVFLYDDGLALFVTCQANWLKWCIQEESCLNLGQVTSYRDWCSLWVASVLPGKCQDISSVRHNHFLFEQTNFEVGETRNIQSISCGLWTLPSVPAHYSKECYNTILHCN